MSDSDVRLSYETFLNNILAIKNLSDNINDDWALNGKTVLTVFILKIAIYFNAQK